MPQFRTGMIDKDLPPVLPSLRVSMRLAYRAEPRLLIVVFAVMVLSWIPEALGALWLKVLIDGVLDGNDGAIRTAATGLAAAAAAGWFLRTLSGRVHMRFRDRATIEIEAHVARLQATVAGLELHERPAIVDRLQLLRDSAFLLNHLYASLFNSIGMAGRLVVTAVLLASIHPVLLVLVVFAIPTVLASSWRSGVERRTEEAAGSDLRLSRHLFEVLTTPGPAKEVRVGGTGPLLTARRRSAWDAWYRQVADARWGSAATYAAAWTLFGLAYVGAIVFVASGLDASPGSVVLALAAGANLSHFLGATVGEAEFLRWTLDASQRVAWLEQYAAGAAVGADQPVPDRLRDGIRLDHVSFRYPGTDRLVLEDVDLDIPAGSVVALVGENGAGKTTLVKLLCGFYAPSEGRVTVDGVDLQRIRPDDWRQRLTGAFQDFFRFEYQARHAIGVGDLVRIDDLAAVEAGVARAGAGDVVERLPQGLATQLGPTWRDGVELSIGQWQKVALARGFVRDAPLLCILDEPTAALDAETEHALFERFAAESRAARDAGRITLLVSHRFSTVRMADLIVVLDASRVVERGSHAELMARGGVYAELFEIQARAYRS